MSQSRIPTDVRNGVASTGRSQHRRLEKPRSSRPSQDCSPSEADMAGLRSFTDPLSSSMQFTAYDLARGLGDLLVHRLPYFALPQVLHELTHQWCFNSVV